LTVELLQVIKPTGEYVEEIEPDIPKEELRRLYRLMVLVRNLDTRSLQLQRQGRIGFFIGSKGLGEKARAGQLSLEEIQGSTFTITNVGGIGGVFATPIINYPEVAILGVHKITKRPVVKDNQIMIRDVTYLSVSFDHRVLAGAMAAQFMNAVKQYLEDPKLLLLETD
jgi:hypothetical protein